MANLHSEPIQKGKWLELDLQNKSNKNILSIIETIDGVDIHKVAEKTYVRFPITPAKKANSFRRIIKVAACMKKTVSIETIERSDPRQYCAVMLKAEDD